MVHNSIHKWCEKENDFVAAAQAMVQCFTVQFKYDVKKNDFCNDIKHSRVQHTQFETKRTKNDKWEKVLPNNEDTSFFPSSLVLLLD